MLLKAIVILIWVFGFSSLFVDYPGVWNTVGHWTLGFMVISHIAEMLFFFKKIKADSAPFGPTLLSSLVYGIVHNRRYLNK